MVTRSGHARLRPCACGRISQHSTISSISLLVAPGQLRTLVTIRCNIFLCFLVQNSSGVRASTEATARIIRLRTSVARLASARIRSACSNRTATGLDQSAKLKLSSPRKIFGSTNTEPRLSTTTIDQTCQRNLCGFPTRRPYGSGFCQHRFRGQSLQRPRWRRAAIDGRTRVLLCRRESRRPEWSRRPSP